MAKLKLSGMKGRFKQPNARKPSTNSRTPIDCIKPASGKLPTPDPAVSEGIIQDAEIYLLHRNGAKSFEQIDLDGKIEQLKNMIIKAHISSTLQKYEAIASAYAMYAMTKIDPELEKSVIRAAKELGKMPTRRTTVLRLIVELHIGYGENDTAEEIRRASKLYSRDVTAIANLIKRNVKPSEVVALSNRPGEGLTTWQRYRFDGEPQETASEAVLSEDHTLSEAAEAMAAMLRKAMPLRGDRDANSDNRKVSTHDATTAATSRYCKNLLIFEGNDHDGRKIFISEEIDHISPEFIKLIFDLLKTLGDRR